MKGQQGTWPELHATQAFTLFLSSDYMDKTTVKLISQSGSYLECGILEQQVSAVRN